MNMKLFSMVVQLLLILLSIFSIKLVQVKNKIKYKEDI